jgi:hypothetical protein
VSRRSYVQRRLRAEVFRFLRLIRGLLLKLLALAIVVCTVPVLIGTPAYETGLIHGFFITATAALVVFAFLLNGDGAFLIAGALGEPSTREELESSVKLGYVWSAVHNVEAGGRDVDHVVLTPSGVLALESKWRFRGADHRWLTWAAGEAEEAARKARLVLQSKDIEHRTQVRPVLVIWGGARRELPDVQIINGVDVVCGQALIRWLEQCSRGRLAEDNAEALHRRLSAFVESRKPSS